MDIFQSVVISIVEGLTEFLPISSTAHMRITNPLVGVSPSPFVDMFEIVIQLAAILSVVTVYWKKFFDFKHYSFYLKLVLALIPAIIFGLILNHYIANALDHLAFIASVMLIGGVILLFIDRFFTHPVIENEKDISYKNAFIVGCFQVLSILFPGLSRSAATIIGGMSRKMTRGVAAEFSFFLAVPTMVAASAKSFYDMMKEHPGTLHSGNNYLILFIGAVVAYFVALLSIKFFISYLKNHSFRAFGWYRIALGAIVLFCVAMGWMH